MEPAVSGSTQARVMIVDDHSMVRDAVRRAIDGPDIKVVSEAANASDALALVEGARPDLILLDIDLPGASGIEIVGQLHSLAPKARIVMLTVSSDDDDVHTAIRLGATGYLTKDVSSEALLRAVQGALSGNLAMPRRLAQRLIDRMASGSAPPPDVPFGPGLELTEREMEILQLLSDGQTAREIGDRLALSPRTVEGHVGKILRKVGARNRVEAVRAYRAQHG